MPWLREEALSVGTFCLIKDEAPWVKAHILSWLPHVDEMIFFDGGSTDGTIPIIRSLLPWPGGDKIKLFLDHDPIDLKDDYVRMSNDAMWSLTTDYAIFAHPDMVLCDPGGIRNLGKHIAYFTNLRSFAGEPGGELFEIVSGRCNRWKNVYRLRNPNFGCHYHGHYGAVDEDCYFKEITGSKYKHHGNNIDRYPYEVGDSGIQVLHYSDVRCRERRIDRMIKCLINQGCNKSTAEYIAPQHPRVSFRDSGGFKFTRAEYHPLLRKVPSGR